MSFRVQSLFCCVLLVLTGCVSSRPDAARPPAWEDPGIPAVTQLPPSPVIAPPASSVAEGPGTIQPAPSKRAERPSDSWVALHRWAAAKGVQCISTGGPQPTFLLKAGEKTLSLRSGSQVIHFGNVDVRSGFAPRVLGGVMEVHQADLDKTIAPLLFSRTWPRSRTGLVVVIDPGHGGQDAGTRGLSANSFEKGYTLDWALRLRSLLVANGIETVLTRINDTDMAISNRVALAQQHRASLFLSLHFNSAGLNEAEAGLETYCLTPAGLPSTITRGYGDDSSQVFPNNQFDAENLQLASRVHEALLAVNGHQDRGVRRARFPGILRGQQCPAILVEGGYLSNSREARLIATPEYRQRLAQAVATALILSIDAEHVAKAPAGPQESGKAGTADAL